MRIRPTFAAAAVTAVTAVTVVSAADAVTAAGAVTAVVAAPGAAPAVAVPGSYRIADVTGSCLHGDGGRNAKAELGECDTIWEVKRRGGGFAIVHTATGHCLSMGLERIYPPFVSTLPCGDEGPAWLISATGDGRVTLSLGTGRALLTGRGIGRPARLLPAEGPPDQQRWILEPA